jgi:hypothetical protein
LRSRANVSRLALLHPALRDRWTDRVRHDRTADAEGLSSPTVESRAVWMLDLRIKLGADQERGDDPDIDIRTLQPARCFPVISLLLQGAATLIISDRWSKPKASPDPQSRRLSPPCHPENGERNPLFAGHLAPHGHDLILADARIHSVTKLEPSAGTNLSRRTIIANYEPPISTARAYSRCR